MPSLGIKSSWWHSQGQVLAALPAPCLAPAPLTLADDIPATGLATLTFSLSPFLPWIWLPWLQSCSHLCSPPTPSV